MSLRPFSALIRENVLVTLTYCERLLRRVCEALWISSEHNLHYFIVKQMFIFHNVVYVIIIRSFDDHLCSSFLWKKMCWDEFVSNNLKKALDSWRIPIDGANREWWSIRWFVRLLPHNPQCGTYRPYISGTFMIEHVKWQRCLRLVNAPPFTALDPFDHPPNPTPHW